MILRSECRFLLLAVVTVAIIASLPAMAQDGEEEIQVGNLHFAFANYLGSGIYSVENRTVQVYHFPTTFDLVSPENRDWGMSIKIPVTLGFYDFRAEDFLVVGLPDRVSTISVVPSLLIPFYLSERWVLTPSVDFGAAKEFDAGELVWVVGLGMQGDAVYQMKGFDLRPLMRAQWAQHTGPVHAIGDNLGRLEAGLESRFPLGFSIFGQVANLGIFGKYYSYMTELELVTPDGMPIDFTNQWEFGATLGTETPLKLWGIKLPRIGVSYRFGENVGAVRLILGKPM